MSSKRRALLAILGTLMAVGLAVLAWPKEQEPSYDGRALSDWLSIYARGRIPDVPDSDVRESEKAATAVRAIGTNALPFLLRWIDFKIPPWRERFLRKYYRYVDRYLVPIFHTDFGVFAALKARPEAQAWAALSAFEILGNDARPAVGELTRRMNAGNERAAFALRYIGQDGLPPLLAVAGDHQSTNRVLAIVAIGSMHSVGTNGNSAIALLTGALSDPDASIRIAATNALEEIAPEALPRKSDVDGNGFE